MSEVGRAVDEADRAKLLATLTQWAAARSFYALRTRALVLLAWGSALRLSECLKLDIEQVLEDPNLRKLGRLRGTAYVRGEQAKGRRKGPRRWNSAGAFVITKPARVALREYLIECVRRGWLTLPAPKGTALFLTIKGRVAKGARVQRGRLGKRAAQHSWTALQKRARISETYRFHDLRHDALTRVGDVSSGNVFKVAQFGRLKDIRTAQRYVHGSMATLAELAELASRAPKGRHATRRDLEPPAP